MPRSSASDPRRLIRPLLRQAHTVGECDALITACRACPRLVHWREDVAVTKKRAFADEEYWGRPVPGFGDPQPRLLIVGLAPGAHGANRTGRVFTGDRAGDFLFGSLHRIGVASSPVSRSRDDGMRLAGVRITAAVHCAPPGNAPTPTEQATCAAWLEHELTLLQAHVKVIVALGALAWRATLAALNASGWSVPSPRPTFGHGAAVTIHGPTTVTLIGSYHPSQQNTFTGRLTEAMLDDVLRTAVSTSR